MFRGVLATVPTKGSQEGSTEGLAKDESSRAARCNSSSQESQAVLDDQIDCK
jgi:hypothetical protein